MFLKIPQKKNFIRNSEVFLKYILLQCVIKQNSKTVSDCNEKYFWPPENFLLPTYNG